MLKAKAAWQWMIPVLLIAVWIGARGLNADALWFDEYWSVYNAGGAHYGPLSPGDIWTRVAELDPWQAPGYFLLLGGWGALVGWTPFALRALSLLAGVLSLAWAYRLGRDLVSPLGGFGAAVTMGLSAYFLYFFHEMRTYTLIVMLIAMTAWAYWRVAHGGGRWPQIALFIGSASLLYTHYFAALTALVLGLYHLLFIKKDARWWRVVFIMGAAGLCFLPWLTVLLKGLDSAVEDTLRQASAWSAGQAVSGVLFMFSSGSAALVVLLGGASIFTSSSPDAAPLNRIVVFAWFWLLGVLGLLLAINARYGVILEVRYLFPLWPALGLVAGLAIQKLEQLGGRRLALLILGLWAAAGVWNSIDARSADTLSNPHWHQPWDVLVHDIRPQAQENDALLYLLPDWTWPGYHQLVFDHYLHDVPVRGTLLERPENLGAEAFEQRVVNAVENAERVWIATTADQPTHYVSHVHTLLEVEGFALCREADHPPHLTLELYILAAGGSAPEQGCER